MSWLEGRQLVEMDWETSKENFQPLKQGRHPTQILEEVSKAPAKAQACAEQERRYVCGHANAARLSACAHNTHKLGFVMPQEVLERTGGVLG